MTLPDFLVLLTRTLFTLLALLSLIDLLRRRDQARLDIALVFSSLAIGVVLDLFVRVTGINAPWFSIIGVCALVAEPFLVLRVVQYFEKVPRLFYLSALGGMLVSWGLYLLTPRPFPAYGLVLVVIYFVIVNGYAAFSFVRGALTTTGVTRQRLRLASIGTGLFAIGMALVGVTALVPALSDVLSAAAQIFAILAAFAYFLGFQPPRTLAQAWQFTELHNFLAETAGRSAAERARFTLQLLCDSAVRLGGRSALVALWDEDARNFKIAASSDPTHREWVLVPKGGAIARAWQEQRAQLATNPKSFGFPADELLRTFDSQALFAVPIRTKEHAWGLLLLFQRRLSLFARDDVALLSLLAEQSAIALDNSSLLDREQSLNHELQVLNQSLEARVAERTAALEAQQLALQQSEARYRQLFDSNPQPLWVNDAETLAFVAVNDAAVRHYGYTRDEFLGMTLGDLVPSDAEPEASRTAANPVLTFESAELQRHRTKDGSWIDVELISHELSLDGKPAQLVLAIDVTARKKAEAALEQALHRETRIRAEVEESRRRLDFLFGASTTLFEAPMDYMSRLRQLAELAVPAIADWCAIDVISEDNQVERVAVVHRDPSKEPLAYELVRRYPVDVDRPTGLPLALRTGEAQLFANVTETFLEQVTRDSQQRELIRRLGVHSYMILPLNARGRTLGAISLVAADSERRYDSNDLALGQDLARRAAIALDNARLYREAQVLNAELDQRVRERTAQLELSNKELEAFSYSVSHDLRAPLRHIASYVELLQRSQMAKLDEKGKHYIEVIVFSTKRMGTLIDDLLNFSRIGRTEMRQLRVSLDEIVKHALDDLKGETVGREIDCEVAPLPTVYGDPSLLRLALQNLLSNAVKYTRPRARARIQVGAHVAENEYIVFVRDNGVGFDADYADKLFGVFQRLHRSEEFEGTGIGLANVRRIIQRHGGRTWAEGAVDEGASFYFSLPMEPAVTAQASKENSLLGGVVRSGKFGAA